MNKEHCQKCGHDWDGRVENPECCPKCKSYDWNKTKGESSPVKDQGKISKVGR